MSEKFTVVGPPVSLAELAKIIEAGQSGGIDAAFAKHAELHIDQEAIKKAARKQRERRTVRVKSKLP